MGVLTFRDYRGIGLVGANVGGHTGLPNPAARARQRASERQRKRERETTSQPVLDASERRGDEMKGETLAFSLSMAEQAMSKLPSCTYSNNTPS